MNPSDEVEGVTDLERHLLINDNEALDLDNIAPTYPPTLDDGTRAVERVMRRQKAGSQID